MFEKRYTLLRSQKRRVYEILQEVGLEPAEFSWSQKRIVELLSVSRLNYQDGEQYYFLFSSYEINSWCIACPGRFRTMDYRYPKNWEEQVGIFRAWAETLKQELDTADPWAALAKYRLAVNGELSRTVVNEPIAAVEAEQIGQALRRLGEGVTAAFCLGGERAALLQAKLDYLAEAARRQRSRDWVYTAMGVWASLAVALTLTEEEAALIWAMLRTEMGPFATLLPARTIATSSPRPKTPVLGIKPAAPESHPEQTRKPS
jgi:hypothetical protein